MASVHPEVEFKMRAKNNSRLFFRISYLGTRIWDSKFVKINSYYFQGETFGYIYCWRCAWNTKLEMRVLVCALLFLVTVLRSGLACMSRFLTWSRQMSLMLLTIQYFNSFLNRKLFFTSFCFAFFFHALT